MAHKLYINVYFIIFFTPNAGLFFLCQQKKTKGTEFLLETIFFCFFCAFCLPSVTYVSSVVFLHRI